MIAKYNACMSLFCIVISKAAKVHKVKILKKGRGGLNGYPASAGIRVRLDELDIVILAGAGEFNEHSITAAL